MIQSRLNPAVISRAIELYATIPNIKHKEVALEIGISGKQLMRLRRDADFWRKVYNKYMVAYEGDLISVLNSMIREAKAGNVQAGRLVLEHSGKLQKKINVNSVIIINYLWAHCARPFEAIMAKNLLFV